MTFADYAIRSLIRAAGARLVWAAPLWLSVLIIGAALLLGGCAVHVGSVYSREAPTAASGHLTRLARTDRTDRTD